MLPERKSKSYDLLSFWRALTEKMLYIHEGKSTLYGIPLYLDFNFSKESRYF